MNRPLSLLLSLCLTLSLAACGSSAPEPEPPAAPQEDEAPPAVLLSEEGLEDLPYGSPVDFNPSGLPEAYAAAIEAYCRGGVYPDGGKADEIPSRIAYAVLDVDGDGRDELILQNANTIMAGQTERIYDYDGAAFREEFSDFPALTYYDNGVIRADWSHNQGWAGEFWPHYLYRYDAGSDAYENMGAVDAWNESLHPTGFPNDVDQDGDGMVYFLLTDNWGFAAYLEPASGEKYYTYEQPPVDGAEYLAWRDSLLQGASPVEIPYQTVNVELIYPNAAG